MSLTAEQKLDNLTDALVADVMAMTDKEILAEAVEEFGSMEAVEAEVARITKVIQDAFPPVR